MKESERPLSEAALDLSGLGQVGYSGRRAGANMSVLKPLTRRGSEHPECGACISVMA